MNDSLNMYDDFSNVVSNEESISTNSVLDILKEYSSNISVFDLMAVNAEMIEESKYVQENYKHKSHEVFTVTITHMNMILIRRSLLMQ